MVEAQLMELATAVQNVQAQLMVSEAARTNLQAQVDRLGRTTGERKTGVDTRNLGTPSQFNGTDTALGGIGQLSFAVTLPWCIRH